METSHVRGEKFEEEPNSAGKSTDDSKNLLDRFDVNSRVSLDTIVNVGSLEYGTGPELIDLSIAVETEVLCEVFAFHPFQGVSVVNGVLVQFCVNRVEVVLVGEREHVDIDNTGSVVKLNLNAALFHFQGDKLVLDVANASLRHSVVILVEFKVEKANERLAFSFVRVVLSGSIVSGPVFVEFLLVKVQCAVDKLDVGVRILCDVVFVGVVMLGHHKQIGSKDAFV